MTVLQNELQKFNLEHYPLMKFKNLLNYMSAVENYTKCHKGFLHRMDV